MVGKGLIEAFGDYLKAGATFALPLMAALVSIFIAYGGKLFEHTEAYRRLMAYVYGPNDYYDDYYDKWSPATCKTHSEWLGSCAMAPFVSERRQLRESDADRIDSMFAAYDHWEIATEASIKQYADELKKKPRM